MPQDDFYMPAREKDKPLTSEQREWVNTHVQKLFDSGHVNLHNAYETDNEGKIKESEKGYINSAEHIYDMAVKWKEEPHIQMVCAASNIQQLHDYSYKSHANIAVVIPDRNEDYRVVIKTPGAIEKDPALKEHKEKLRELTQHLSAKADQSRDLFVSKHPERVVLIYKKDADGNFTLDRAFGGVVDVDYQLGFASKHDVKGDTPEEIEFNMNYARGNHGQLSSPKIILDKTYNPHIGNIQNMPGDGWSSKFSLPIDGALYRESDNTAPHYAPSREQAQEFLDKIKALNLAKAESKTRSDDGLSNAMQKALAQAAATNGEGFVSERNVTPVVKLKDVNPSLAV